MGLFSAIFGKAKINVPDQGFWTLLDGYTPTFSSWGGELYESEIVRAAVHATAFLSTPSARRATAKTERKPSAFVSLYTSLHKLQRGACKTNRKITPLLVQTAGIPVRSVRENHVRCLFALAGHQKISTLSCANSGCSPTCSTLVW